MSESSTPSPRHELFTGSKFEVEHALDIYADSFSTFPVHFLYRKDFIASLKKGPPFHIYLIGYLPKTEELEVQQRGDRLCLSVSVGDRKFTLLIAMPQDMKLVQNAGGRYLEDTKGNKWWMNHEQLLKMVSTTIGGLQFNVKYIGQAFGKKGSRTAIDRLLKHETLQRIAIEQAPPGTEIQILLLSIQAPNRIITAFIPDAMVADDGGTRRKQGLDKLFFSTTEAERISLFEAALIRYFNPQFNQEFKNSFPSTNMKILKDCYKRDFLALIAEICIDSLPFVLCSEKVDGKHEHIATFDLHNDQQRKIFFGILP